MLRNQQGFSVIELMAAVVILAVTLSVGVPGFSQFIANSQIRSTTESIKNGLQSARAEAIKRNAQVRFTLFADSSWRVGCVVVVAVTCPLVIQTKAAREGSTNKITIATTGSNNIIFTNLGTPAAVAGQLSQVNVDHTSIAATNSRDLRITIGAGGNTRMCDPNVSTTGDARKC